MSSDDTTNPLSAHVFLIQAADQSLIRVAGLLRKQKKVDVNKEQNTARKNNNI